jgi:carbon-monoxide dehydrogenase medium subunit
MTFESSNGNGGLRVAARTGFLHRAGKKVEIQPKVEAVKNFEYFAPQEIGEALILLAQHAESAKPLAGGTDLFLRMARESTVPRFVVDLKKITDLRGVKSINGKLRLGALTLMDDVASCRLVHEGWRILAEGARAVGSVQTRNRATLGGNLCNASPAADTAPPLLALQARAKIVSSRGEREIPLESFFVGPGKSCLLPDELLKEIVIPPGSLNSGGSFYRCTRVAMDIALVNSAVLLTWNPSEGTIDEIRIALGAVAPTPIRATRAEDLLRGREPTLERIQEAADQAALGSRPIDDVRSSAAYRCEIVRVLTCRAIEDALKDARNQGERAQRRKGGQPEGSRESGSE